MANAALTFRMERRRCEYKEFNTAPAQVGHCLLITGGMMSPPVAIVERHDGTVAVVQVERIQFIDIAPWADVEPSTPIYNTTEWVEGQQAGLPSGNIVYTCKRCFHVVHTPTPFCSTCGRRAREVIFPT